MLPLAIGVTILLEVGEMRYAKMKFYMHIPEYCMVQKFDGGKF